MIGTVQRGRKRSQLIKHAARFVLAACVVYACAPAYSVVLEAPGFDAKRTTRMQGNSLGAGRIGANDAELNLQRIELGADTIYRVELRHIGDGVPIDEVAPLQLLLNGDTLTLARDSTASVVTYDGYRVERALYRASDAELRRLAAATDLEIRFRLGAWTEARRPNPRALERIRAFVREYVGAEE